MSILLRIEFLEYIITLSSRSLFITRKYLEIPRTRTWQTVLECSNRWQMICIRIRAHAIIYNYAYVSVLTWHAIFICVTISATVSFWFIVCTTIKLKENSICLLTYYYLIAQSTLCININRVYFRLFGWSHSGTRFIFYVSFIKLVWLVYICRRNNLAGWQQLLTIILQNNLTSP